MSSYAPAGSTRHRLFRAPGGGGAPSRTVGGRRGDAASTRGLAALMRPLARSTDAPHRAVCRSKRVAMIDEARPRAAAQVPRGRRAAELVATASASRDAAGLWRRPGGGASARRHWSELFGRVAPRRSSCLAPGRHSRVSRAGRAGMRCPFVTPAQRPGARPGRPSGGPAAPSHAVWRLPRPPSIPRPTLYGNSRVDGPTRAPTTRCWSSPGPKRSRLRGERDLRLGAHRRWVSLRRRVIDDAAARPGRQYGCWPSCACCWTIRGGD